MEQEPTVAMMGPHVVAELAGVDALCALVNVRYYIDIGRNGYVFVTLNRDYSRVERSLGAGYARTDRVRVVPEMSVTQMREAVQAALARMLQPYRTEGP